MIAEHRKKVWACTFTNKPCSSQGAEEESSTSSSAEVTARRCSLATTAQLVPTLTLGWRCSDQSSCFSSSAVLRAGPQHLEEMSSSPRCWILSSFLLLLGESGLSWAPRGWGALPGAAWQRGAMEGDAGVVLGWVVVATHQDHHPQNLCHQGPALVVVPSRVMAAPSTGR